MKLGHRKRDVTNFCPLNYFLLLLHGSKNATEHVLKAWIKLSFDALDAYSLFLERTRLACRQREDFGFFYVKISIHKFKLTIQRLVEDFKNFKDGL